MLAKPACRHTSITFSACLTRSFESPSSLIASLFVSVARLSVRYFFRPSRPLTSSSLPPMSRTKMALMPPWAFSSCCVRTLTVRSEGNSCVGSFSGAFFGSTSLLWAAFTSSDGSAMSICPSRSAGLKLMMKKNSSWNVMSSMGVIGRTISDSAPGILRSLYMSRRPPTDLGPDLHLLEPGRLAVVHHLEHLAEFEVLVGPEVDGRRHLAVGRDLRQAVVLVAQPGLRLRRRHRRLAGDQYHRLGVLQAVAVLGRQAVEVFAALDLLVDEQRAGVGLVDGAGRLGGGELDVRADLLGDEVHVDDEEHQQLHDEVEQRRQVRIDVFDFAAAVTHRTPLLLVVARSPLLTSAS